MFEEIARNFKFSKDNETLLISLGILVVLIILFVAIMLYYNYLQKKAEFKHFTFLIGERNIAKDDMKRLFNYLTKHKIDPKLILESEEVMERAVKGAGLDLAEMREKLGFDKGSLIKRYLERQEELRKKWNS
ncbi:hypothetical protein NitYY0826_C1191 [Nitratiruptor sp. YY08-26]|uniref:hypothetical protein n=1 Tax=unclassified Nitratiruptor TaxID=2624044 RepID=UPI001915F31A|nr:MULTISPECIES: hypothetical protein [unclassified Nitratiruptor]BCD62315.1 hypothetical protein NitYY0813_C1189 [Nitratiruptor sp. YY08-13]BCD66251.1 hypothetical protein NitYY0826_C1191 [Nitratiruptor sp. YY08-26]